MSLAHCLQHWRASLDEFPQWYARYVGKEEGRSYGSTTRARAGEKVTSPGPVTPPRSSEVFQQELGGTNFSLTVRLESTREREKRVLVPLVSFKPKTESGGWEKVFSEVRIAENPKNRINIFICEKKLQKQYTHMRIFEIAIEVLTPIKKRIVLGMRLKGYNENEINDLVKSTYTEANEEAIAYPYQTFWKKEWQKRLERPPLHLLEAREDSRLLPASSVSFSLPTGSSFLVTPRPVDKFLDLASCRSFSYELREKQDLSTILSLKLPEKPGENATLGFYYENSHWKELKEETPAVTIQAAFQQGKNRLVPTYSHSREQILAYPFGEASTEQEKGTPYTVLVQGSPHKVCRLRLGTETTPKHTLHIDVLNDKVWKEEARVETGVEDIAKSIVFHTGKDEELGIFLVEGRLSNKFVYFINTSSEGQEDTRILDHREDRTEVVWSAHTDPRKKETVLVCLDGQSVYLVVWKNNELKEMPALYVDKIRRRGEMFTVVHLTRDAQNQLYLCAGSSLGNLVTGKLLFSDNERKITFTLTSRFKAHEAPVAGIYVQHKKEGTPKLWTTALDGSVFLYEEEGLCLTKLRAPAEGELRLTENPDFHPFVQAALESGREPVLEIPHGLPPAQRQKLIESFESAFGNVQDTRQVSTESLLLCDALLRPQLYAISWEEQKQKKSGWGGRWTIQTCRIFRKEDNREVGTTSLTEFNGNTWSFPLDIDERVEKAVAVQWFKDNVNLQLVYPGGAASHSPIHLQLSVNYYSDFESSLPSLFQGLEKHFMDFWPTKPAPDFVLQITKTLTELERNSFERMISVYFKSLSKK